MSRKAHILYIDDDPDDLILVSDAFRSITPELTMHVFTSWDIGKEFLESIPVEEFLPDLIILDLNMPGKNGLEILELLKANIHYQPIPITIFTNSDYPKHRNLALSKGASDFVTKPYTASELKEVCKKMMTSLLQEPLQKNH